MRRFASKIFQYLPPRKMKTDRMPIPFKALVLSLLALLLSCFAQAKVDTTAMRIGLAGTPPFFNADKTGISIDIWDHVARDMDIRYTTVAYSSVPDALQALEAGEVDAVVGPVSISSERVARMDLTQPYFRSSLSILSRTDELSAWERIQPFFSVKLLYALFLFLFILAIVGTLLWLAERKASSDQFPLSPAQGIGNGMWCAISTMSTTGYGDIAPVTLAGRIIAGSWMVISIIFATTMVAGIASTLTLTGLGHTVIDTAEKLPGKRVAVLAGSPAADFVADHGGRAVPEADLDSCYAALKNKRVDAIVFDRPQLLYFFKKKNDRGMAVAPSEYQPQGYGFAFPLHSPFMPEVDVELLRLKESGDLDHILKNWLGEQVQ